MKNKSILVSLLVSAMFGGACGKDDASSSDSKNKASSSKKEKPAKEDKAKAKGLEGLFTGTSVTLPKEVAALTFGGSEAEALKQVGIESNYWTPKGYKKVRFSLGKTSEIVDSFEIQADDPLEETITKQWGAPMKDKDGTAFWFNPEKAIRAFLPKHAKGKSLKFEAYQPLQELLGKEGFALEFAKDKALVGASVKELQEAWGDALCNFSEQGPKIQDAFTEHVADSLNQFPPNYGSQIDICWQTKRGMHPYSASPGKVSFGGNGRVVAFYLSVVTGGSAPYAKTQIAVLDAKFGTPVVVAVKDGEERYYFDAASKHKVKVSRDKDNSYVTIAYQQYMPLEELLGGDGPGISVEPPSVFGSFEAIAKEDPEHFQPSGVLASLFYPGTEYAGGLTEIQLNKMAHAKKVSSYKFVLHYGDNPAHEAEILELLEKKWGAPSSPKKEASNGKYLNYKNGKRKISVWQVNTQFQITVSK